PPVVPPGPSPPPQLPCPCHSPVSIRKKIPSHPSAGLNSEFFRGSLSLKAAKPLGQHFTISLANGYNGYLPTPEHHRLGGYETWRARSSYLETEAATVIVKTLRELLAEVAR
ncbi:MAG: hypothetical protein Q8N18_24280, partial [Opitutaceae bacterium]|nr:hypothetical protein [Opitutaceae bacterium]